MRKSMIGRKYKKQTSQELRNLRSEYMKKIWEERKKNADSL
jgi:hypothetical protein